MKKNKKKRTIKRCMATGKIVNGRGVIIADKEVIMQYAKQNLWIKLSPLFLLSILFVVFMSLPVMAYDKIDYKNEATFNIIKQTEECLINCEINLNVTLYKSDIMPSLFNFVDKDSNLYPLDYEVFIKRVNIEVIPNKKTVCPKDETIEKGNCYSTEESYKEVKKEYYDKLNPNEIFPVGSYELKVNVRKPLNKAIDWAFSYKDLGSNDVRKSWAWFNSNWSNAINLTGLNTSLYYSILNISFINGMSSNFSDLRFTILNSSDDNIELSYWIEDRHKVNSGSAIVRLETRYSNNVTMYYNNSIAESSSSLSNLYGSQITSFYTFEESSGSGIDLFNGQTNFTNTNMNYSQTGKFFRGYDYELSISSKSDFGETTDWQGATGSYHLFWVNLESIPATGYFYDSGSASYETMWSIVETNNQVQCQMWDTNSGVGIIRPNTLFVNNWTLFGCFYNGTSQDSRMILNGKIVAENNASWNDATSLTGGSGMNFFHKGGASFIDGQIDDYMQFNAEPTATQLLNIYNTGIVSNYTLSDVFILTTPPTPTPATTVDIFDVDFTSNISITILIILTLFIFYLLFRGDYTTAGFIMLILSIIFVFNNDEVNLIFSLILMGLSIIVLSKSDKK